MASLFLCHTGYREHLLHRKYRPWSLGRSPGNCTLRLNSGPGLGNGSRHGNTARPGGARVSAFISHPPSRMRDCTVQQANFGDRCQSSFPAKSPQALSTSTHTSFCPQRDTSSQSLSCHAKRCGQLYAVSQRVHRLPGAHWVCRCRSRPQPAAVAVPPSYRVLPHPAGRAAS